MSVKGRGVADYITTNPRETIQMYSIITSAFFFGESHLLKMTGVQHLYDQGIVTILVCETVFLVA